MNIGNKDDIYELPHELPNETSLRILGIRKHWENLKN